MSPAEVRIGMPVVVSGGPGYRRGRITEGPYDVRYGPWNSTWRVEFEFSLRVSSLYTALEMEPADVVTRLGVLLSECRVEQEEEVR